MKAQLRLLTRLFCFALHLVVGAVLCVTVFPRDSRKMKHRQEAIVQWWLGVCVRILGVCVKVRGEWQKPKQGKGRPFCVVANHVSWVDILVLGSLYPLHFLSKAEIKGWFLIGYLASRSGTLYIKRGTGGGKALQEMANCFDRGGNVGLFPEGSTGKDSEVRKFYPRLFEAAVMANAVVQPISIAYPCAGKLHPAIQFPKNENFLHNTFKVMREKQIKVTVDLLAAVPVQESYEQTARMAQEMVARHTEYAYDRSA